MNNINDLNKKNKYEDNILNNIATGIMEYEFTEDNLKVITVNSVMCDIVGFTAEEITSWAASDLIDLSPEEYREYIWNKVHSLRQPGNQIEMVYPIENYKTGKKQWLETRGKSFVGPSGEIRFFLTYYDVTNVKEQEIRFTSNMTALSLVQNQARISVWTYYIDAHEIEMQSLTEKTDNMGFAQKITNFPQCLIDGKFIHPDDEAKFLELIQKLEAGQETADLIFRCYNRIIEKFDWIHVYYQRVHNNEGGRQAVGFSVEVNQQQQLIERYKAELMMRKQLFHHAPLMVEANMSKGLVVGMEGGRNTYTDINAWDDIPFADYHKYVVSLVDKPYKQMMQEKTSQEGILQKFDNGDKKIVIVFRGRGTKESPLLFYRTSIYLSNDPLTNDVMAFFYTEDIDKNYKSRMAMESCMEDGNDFIALINQDTKQLEVFKSAAVYGKLSKKVYDYEEFLDKAVRRVFGEQVNIATSRANWDRVLRKLATAEKYEYARAIRTVQGEIQHKLIRFKYFDYTKEDIVMSITDVTELYLEEQEKNEKLQEALDNAQRANDITNQFMARMSHDMRTPMNGILGMARLSWDEMDIDEIKRNMVKIEKSGKYLLGLINDTLDYQIISSKKMKLNPVVFNPNTMLQNVESMVRVTADEKNVELRMKINIPDMKWDVRGDELRIQQICMNLLSNAIKFTPSGGTVEFVLEELSCDGNISHDLIVVRDSGIGMTQEFIETGLFKPLSQEKNDYTRTYAGSGLGLSIVKSLVELMGGHIEVHSEIGEGTEIRVYLNAERVPRSQSQIMQPVEEEDFANLQGKRILIVEDNSLNAEIAKHLLENKGCITLTAENGALGLECFAKSAPNELDLIVMDIRMPVMDGLEATRQIRKLSRPDAQTVPIIAMTANAFDRDIQACREAGMTDHLVKPVDPTKLYRTLVRNLHTMDVPRG